MLTEDVIDCPVCDGHRVLTRYGSFGWWQFDFCFDCGFYKQYDGFEDVSFEEAKEALQPIFKELGWMEDNA